LVVNASRSRLSSVNRKYGNAPPFKRLKDVTRAEGEDVLETKAEIEKARAAYQQKGN
jgi:hypothetical protein